MAANTPRRVVRQSVGATRTTSVTRSSAGRLKEELKNETKTADIDGLPANPSYVAVGGSATRNLGNYESAKVSVTISIPCGNTDEERRDAVELARNLVHEYVELELSEIDEANPQQD